MMENLSLLNFLENCSTSEMGTNNSTNTDNLNDNYWRIIEEINWFDKSRNSDRNSQVAEYLKRNFTLDEICRIKNFVVKERCKVQGFIIGFLKNSSTETKKKFMLSDDGIWDLSAHIVGLGFNFVQLVFRCPEIIFALQNDKEENFEYGFDKAIYDLQYEL